MRKRKFIVFEDNVTSVTFPKFGDGTCPKVAPSAHAFAKGKKNASTYSEDQLLDMLKSNEYEQVYEALGAIGRRKLKRAIAELKCMALYDDDLAIRQEAIRTIKAIGGRAASDILRLLKTTEHKEFIDDLEISR